MDIGKVVSIALISLLGAMSPGPDFAIVTRNCLKGNFRTGLLTALGVTTAVLIHITYCLFGIAILIQESTKLFLILKYLGAGYLFYLGILLLREKISPQNNTASDTQGNRKHNPFLSGFLCNLLNPKATLFILSLFTQFIDPKMHFFEKALLGSVIAIMTFIWFVSLSFLITHHLLKKHFIRFQVIITKTMGVVLCLLALYVAVKSDPIPPSRIEKEELGFNF